MSEPCCVVTGGAGFIGSHLVDAFLRDGWRVRVVDRRCIGNPNLQEASKYCELVEGDFGDPQLMRVALRGADALLHYASTTTPGRAQGNHVFDAETNLIGTLRLLEEAVNAGVSRCVFSSSGGTVYGPSSETPISEDNACAPICSHGIIKRAIESYIAMLGLQGRLTYTILRYANPYGPRQRPDGDQGAVAIFAGKILLGKTIELWGDGSVVRDFLYISDLVSATVKAVQRKEAVGCVLNIGSGIGVTIRELISCLEQVTGRAAKVMAKERRTIDVPVSILGIDEAQRRLGWVPTVRLQEGLASTIPWVEAYLCGEERNASSLLTSIST
jgi:UDP-glucose 4-epimerase